MFRHLIATARQVQHEFVEAERRLLGRADAEITARAGYAGGGQGALDGKVCYHNGKRVSDYGSLGHAEVVRLRIPPGSFADFAAVYAGLFDKNGYRPDQAGDRGSEYRNLVGFAGGAGSDVYLRRLIDASKANGDKLAFAEGGGDDPDRRALVFVMDTAQFPFFVSEQYHQVSSHPSKRFLGFLPEPWRSFPSLSLASSTTVLRGGRTIPIHTTTWRDSWQNRKRWGPASVRTACSEGGKGNQIRKQGEKTCTRVKTLQIK